MVDAHRLREASPSVITAVFYRKKHYLCLSAPAMPMPAPPVAPGPGAYDLRDYAGPPKHYMSSSMFVSSSSRWHDVSGDKAIPGPGESEFIQYMLMF